MARQTISEKTSLTRIAGLCGMFIPFLVFSGIALALLFSPWFQWTEHALSDLGRIGLSAFLFNSTLILGGVLLCIFSLGLIKILDKTYSAYLLMISAFALIGVGIFPVTHPSIHLFFSALFFVFLALSLLLLGLTKYHKKSLNHLSHVALVLALVAISSIFMLLLWDGVAIPESLSFFPAFILFSIYGIQMILL